jgi:glycosyltransferase involved in cell wall biosynthesis
MILPNVLDLLFESPLPVRKDRGGEFVFVNVASLDHKKGLDILIRAFAKAFRGRSSVRLYLCGDGPLAVQLKALAAELGVGETVVFRGRLAKAEVVKILDGADFFVLPSRMETFGVVVIEALARGVPVIATRSGGPEYIVEESTGLLVEPEDEGQLVGALVGAYEGRLVVKSAAEIRATALRRYGSDEFLKNMIQLYNSVVQ